MAQEAELVEDEIEEAEEAELEEDEAEEEETEEGEEDDRPEETSEDDQEEGEVIVSFGEEEPESEEAAPEWVRNLRKKEREKTKRIRELEALIQQQKPVEIGPEPKLEDFDYDTEAHQAALIEHLKKKQALEQKQQEQQAKLQAEEQAFIERQQNYVDAAKSLKVPNYEDAEELVKDVLSDEQRQLIIEGIDDAKDQALMVYALGRNPEKLQKLAKIDSLPRFAVELGNIQKDLKVTNRKPNSKPEQKPKGGASIGSGRLQNKIEQERAKAQKTGNWDRYFELKRKASD